MDLDCERAGKFGVRRTGERGTANMALMKSLEHLASLRTVGRRASFGITMAALLATPRIARASVYSGVYGDAAAFLGAPLLLLAIPLARSHHGFARSATLLIAVIGWLVALALLAGGELIRVSGLVYLGALSTFSWISWNAHSARIARENQRGGFQ